jgi:hypothetical protein
MEIRQHTTAQALEAKKKIRRTTRTTKKTIKMKVGYTILNAVSNYDNIIEVVNHEKKK